MLFGTAGPLVVVVCTSAKDGHSMTMVTLIINICIINFIFDMRACDVIGGWEVKSVRVQ